VIVDGSPAPEPAAPKRTFGFDVALSTGGRVLFVLCGALMTVLIARYLGPEGQGRFAVAYSLTLLLVQVGTLGLSVSNPYFAARRPESQRAIVLHSLWIAAVAAVCLAGAATAVRILAPGTLRGLSGAEIAITLGALPAALATVYLQGVLVGQQRMAWFSVVEVTQAGSSLIALVVAFAVASPGLDVVLIIVAGGRYLALLVAVFALRAVLRQPAVPEPGLVRRLLAHASRVYFVSLLSFALFRLDVLIVNGLLGAADTGQYSIATYITEALIVLPSIVSVNLVPRIATSEESDMTAVVTRSLMLLWAAVCLISVPVAAIAVPLVFGEGFTQAVTLYAWLAPGAYFLGVLSALMAHYWVRGYPRSLIVAWIAGLAVNVVGNVLLLPKWGVTVASIMSSATYAIVLVAHLVVFSREAGGPRALRPSARETVGLVRNALGRSPT
jgi:O-antigen/teichoic acid export membrane protein